MAESSHFTEAEYYQKSFDSRANLFSRENFYSRPEGHSDENNYVSFILGCLSRIFSTGEYKGRKLIEVGSGPAIHTVISACQHYHELVLSDFVDGNREEIKKWINNEEGCFDWKPIIEYVCELDGKSSSDVEVKLRQRIKQVLKCNVLLENPFHPESMEPADCVITSLCLETGIEKKWINNEEGCFDWKPIIEYVCELDGKSSSDVEVKLRQKIKQVLKCNVLLENPFHLKSIEPADCVITSLCLEAACKDMQSYTDALCGVTKLLRPGGVLVMIGVLGESFYFVDEIHFSCLNLSEENIEDVVSKLGFTVQELAISPAEEQENKVSNYDAFFILVALKSNV
ncbi:hypothetical protein KOW79_020667 [Hemibagrus wyckioides]|uniref:Nicotinamide N-methyltransferase n=1 Tax=Hemibagrus wyckioides TaxID=337641 RepID=A0A9D3S911_9TELE|nr:hypothetical protein KOW79_020667 [Hemibagrus wyckioides]